MLSNSELLMRLGLAAALGCAIGLDRQRLLWAAGLRTHMLVCVGSALVMIVSSFGFSDILGTADVMLDPSRVAAQVVSGIGFLGAGTILLRGQAIKGLTTAASLWAVAAVGLAVGGGLYVASIATTAIILVILAGIKPIEERYRARALDHSLRFRAPAGTLTVERLQTAIGPRTQHVRQLVVEEVAAENADSATITLQRTPAKTVDEIVSRLKAIPGVTALEITSVR